MRDFFETYGGEDMIERSNSAAFSYTPTKDQLLEHFDSFSGLVILSSFTFDYLPNKYFFIYIY